MMMLRFALLLLTALFAGNSAVKAAAIALAFDTQAEIAKLPGAAKISLNTDNKVTGTGAVSIRCDLDANGCKIDLPENSHQGVITLWLYDPLFETGERMDRGFDIRCTTLEGGKQKPATFWLHGGTSDENWFYRDSEGVRDLDFYIRRHRGWTRFDIVNPAGEEPQQFLVYIDGRLAGKTPTKYVNMTSVMPKSYWGNGTILIDEFSFNDDPASLKPNVITAVHANADEANTIALSADEKLQFTFKFAASSANAKAGKLTLRMYDGAENEIGSQAVDIDWEKQKRDLAVEFPHPPHSGLYWIKAVYEDGGTAYPQNLLERFNIQFYQKEFDTRNKRIVLADAWDWLPVGEKAPYRTNIATPETTPAAPPQDWSAAQPVKGVWNRDFNLTYQSGWYHRQINIPRNWQGAPVVLDIDEPQTIATIYINGTNAGEIEWPGGTLDITRHVEAGKIYDLSIFVRAEALAGYNRVLREILGDSFKPTECVYMRGLRGEVKLRSEPKDAAISRSALAADVSGGQLKVSVSLEKLKPGHKYSIRSAVSASGKTVLAIPEMNFTASSPSMKISAKVPWKNAVLWDIQQPFLYDFNAMLCENGRPLDIRPPERFGFREVKFERRLVKLNRRTINLFGPITTQFNTHGTSQGMKEMHASFIFGVGFRHAVALGAGDSALQDYADYCANAGIGGNIRLGWFYTKMLTSQNKESDPRYWEFFEKMVRYETGKYGNNPGIFFWADLGSLLDMGSLYNPLLQDGLWIRDFSQTPQLERLAAVQKRVVGILRAADPSRHIIGQNTGSFLDVCQITHYAGFAPMQELIEMNQNWVENGVKPLFYSEQAAPFISNWSNHPRDKGHATQKIIPYEAEWCAITKGDQAFVRTGLDDKILNEYEKLSKGRFEPIRQIKDEVKRQKALADYTNSANTAFPTQLYGLSDTGNLRNEVARDRILEQILNWRADGIGLLITQYFNDLGHQMPECLDTALSPVTGFISGPPENRHDKTHIYASGETMRHGLVLLNNSAQSRKLRYEWKLELAGKPTGSHEATVELPAGETLVVPVSCPIGADQDCEGTLSMGLFDAADQNKKISGDQTPINVLAPRPFKNANRIALIDPEGDSSEALKQAGVKFQLVPFTMDLRNFDTIIFGRRAFGYELKASEQGIDLGKLLQSGKKVVVLEQSEETLRNRFKFRTEYISPRNVYAREFKSGLFEGLPNRCLEFWRGASTLTDGYAVARENLKPRPNEGNGGRWFYEWNDGKEHTRPMKWGNNHNVATVVIIKPDTGNFRTLADCEFALNYAAAWQLQHAKGYVVFSQMDVSGRTQKAPEASRYLQNLIRYVEALPAPQTKAAVYLGDENGAKLLSNLSVPCGSIREADPDRNVLILGDASTQQLREWKSGLDHFIAAGGTVFSLPKPPEAFAAGWTPLKIETVKKPINHTVIGANPDPLLAGLGNSDFYWKGNIEVSALQKIPGANLELDNGLLARLPQGKGEWIFCQIEPSMFDYDPNYFWLKDSKRSAERMLRTLLSNLQVAMPPPDLLKSPTAAATTLFSADLAGEWQCGFATGETPQASPIAQVRKWKKTSVPGNYREKGTEWEPARGSIWYKRNFDLAELPRGQAEARLFLGAVEGIDHVLINGKQVGNTSRITNPDDLSTANRSYFVPLGILKPGVNEIAIFVQFDTSAPLSPGNGNIVTPATLEFFQKQNPAGKDAQNKQTSVRGPYLYDLEKSDDPYSFCGW